MRGLRVGQTRIFWRIVSWQNTLDRTRYATSQWPRPVLLVLELIGRIFAGVARVFIRFFPLTSSIACFIYVFSACQLFLVVQLPGSWAPAFPVARMNFVATLLAVPIWGLAMALFTVVWISIRWLWNMFHARMLRRQRYVVLEMDLEDLDAHGDRQRSRRESQTASRDICRTRAQVGWFVLWCGYIAVALSGIYMLRTYELPIDHRFKADVQLANRLPKREGYGTGEKIYIAAMFYNNDNLLPYWITEVTKVIYYLGPDNVFVSIVESYSSDTTADLLEEFDRKLEKMGVSRRIRTRDTSIERPASMDTAPPRIQYLAAVRNLVMEPLVARGGYTRVLFSNDVFIEAESIVELLDTNGGDFDMACGLDLAYWGLYDQWVIRDRLGRIASTLYPYFLEDTGFRAVMADEPAPVFTCWNGITAIRADPFLPPSLRSGKQLSTAPFPNPLPSTHPSYPRPEALSPALTPPLRFRPSAPDECFSSESFLLPYDLRRQFDLQHIYVNPRVINGYSWVFYVWWKYVARHWAVRWWIEQVERGRGVLEAKMILGDPAKVWLWDGGECHPW
ncbi:cryptococcal mannosyltransferase 1-domain-containing protein [Mycena crocata]|nr:cryptococcal mannosyltransferase 1-domain-containing protein [Mycena crocata]